MADKPANFTGVVTPAANVGVPVVKASWRTRWFWRWQAWRLRKHRTQEHGCGVAVYDSRHALEHLGFADAFYELQRDLSTHTPGLMPDGTQAFARRLDREMSGTCAATMLGAPDGSLGGYAWGRVGMLAEAIQHYQQVQSLGHLHSDDWQVLQRMAGRHFGNAPVLALNGIGLSVRYRKGFAPLKQLLKPLLELGLHNSAQRAIWWVPRNSPLYAMSCAFGARRVHATTAVAFFVLADTRPLGRVFAALPASGIAALLGRIQPQRQAPVPPRATKPRLAMLAKKPLTTDFAA